ncbi:MAG: gamma-glutamyltransferase family protein [Betaproteobacteria bacterium]|nr:gamma-glutamyltransferase family protein [Betaproteobacteria bacterium]
MRNAVRGIALSLSLLAASAQAQLNYRIPDLPEAASGYQAKPGWHLKQRGVAAANPLASDAGYQVLQAGGTAVDAAIAVQMVLTLVEPQSSGIGGGAFLLHHDNEALQVFDGRETAPALATDRLFMVEDKPMAFNEAVVGGRSVGVPGLLRMLAKAHQQHGALPWAQLFEPAIALAEQGFPVSPRLHALLSADNSLQRDPQASAYFFQPDGKPWPVGHRLQNPALAHIFKRIAQEGAEVFYSGEIAQAMVDKVQQHPDNPGFLSLEDLSNYQALERDALCFVHASTFSPTNQVQICGVGPPSSGLITIGQIMGMLSTDSLNELPPSAWVERNTLIPSTAWLHNYNEAARLAFADRAQYIADPAFVSPPAQDWGVLLEPSYLQERASHIGDRRIPKVSAGTPGSVSLQSWAPMPDQTEYGTSHISIVDGLGNALAMTTTIESGFGSRLMVTVENLPGGFLLNNQLTDFSFVPQDESGRPVANRVQAGKRPRSSMSPTLVFAQREGNERGELLASLGSPGGAMIIHFTAQTLWGLLHWTLDAQQAINLPHSGLTGANTPLLLESGLFPFATLSNLQILGHSVKETDMPSGLQALQRMGADWFGAADPRREGVVAGD